MRLIPDWKRTLRHAWSMWCIYAAIILSGLEGVCYLFPDTVMAWLKGWALAGTFLVCALAPFARIKAQKEFDDGRS